MTKTWPNVNPRFGAKPVPTDFEAHAVAATAFVVMTYTHKAKVKDAEQLGRRFSALKQILCFLSKKFMLFLISIMASINA
jgi:hypothetical protein